MTHHTSAAHIGFDRRSGMTRKPKPSEPFLEYQAVERYMRERFAKIDRYLSAVKWGEHAAALLVDALAEHRG